MISSVYTELARSKKGIYLSQRKYVFKMVTKARISGYKPEYLSLKLTWRLLTSILSYTFVLFFISLFSSKEVLLENNDTKKLYIIK